MRHLRWIGTVILCFVFVGAIAQPKKEVRKGNDLYNQQKYKEAAESYQKALLKQPNYTPGLFNLGNAQYKQKDYETSRKLMQGVAKTTDKKEQQAAANYNIGNSYLEENKYKEAIESYKEALRKNPQDEQAKYNLSYALQKMKNQQGGSDDKNNKDKKDQDKKDENQKDKNKQNDEQNKDKNDQQNKQDQNDKKEEQEQDQQQNKQDQNKDKQEEQRPQPQPSKLSEQQAEQLLNALQQEEKKLQDKMKKGKATRIRVEKDW